MKARLLAVPLLASASLGAMGHVAVNASAEGGSPNRSALPFDPVALARAKAAAEARAAPSSSGAAPSSTLPITPDPIASPSWGGQGRFTFGAPPDPTGAIGPTRYVELL